MKNYIKFNGFFSTKYMYADTEDYLASSIFCKYHIPVKYIKEYYKSGEKYILVKCKIRNKHVADFEKAMKDLVTKMNLFGHMDYENYCTKMIKYLMSDE